MATAFAPIVILWLIFKFSFGVYISTAVLGPWRAFSNSEGLQDLVVHDHTVSKALSPYFAGQYLVRNKTEGWKSLGGILLAFTGVEAL